MPSQLEERVEHVEREMTSVKTLVERIDVKLEELHRLLVQGRENSEQGGLVVRLATSEAALKACAAKCIPDVEATKERIRATDARLAILEAKLSVLVWFGGPIFSAIIGTVVWLATK